MRQELTAVCQSLFDTVSLFLSRLHCVHDTLFFLSVYVPAVKKSCKLMWHPLLYAVRIIHSCRANFRPVNNLMQKKKRHAFDASCKILNTLIWCDLQKCLLCQQSTLKCVMKNVPPGSCFWKQPDCWICEKFWICVFHLHLVSSTMWIYYCVVKVWAKWQTRHSIRTLGLLH